MKSILKSILEPIWNGLMVDLGSIWGRFGLCGVHFGIHLGSIFGSIWGPHRDLAGIRASDPLGTRFLTPGTGLGASLGPHVGPMLAPCWQLLGVLGHLGAFLERSRAYLEAVSVQHGT